MTFGDGAAWTSVLLSLLVAIVTITNWWREKRQALTALHVALTTGETANARNTIGTLFYSGRRLDRPGRSESIRAYFDLIWAMQRARNVFRIYKIRWLPLRRLGGSNKTARSEAIDALNWNLREIADNIARFREEYGEIWAVEDEDAWLDIRDFFDQNQFFEHRGYLA